VHFGAGSLTADPLDAPHRGAMPELIAVSTFRGRLEAEAAQTRLAAAGIEAVLAADDSAGWGLDQPFVRGVRLLVEPDDFAEASHLLSGAAPEG
jgi:hypothetical protein